MSWLQRSTILVSRCFKKIKDFTKRSQNISEELEAQEIKSSLNHQLDARHLGAWHCGLRS